MAEDINSVLAELRARQPVSDGTGEPSETDKVLAEIRNRGASEGSFYDAPVTQEPIDPNSASAALGRGLSGLKQDLGGTLEAIGEAAGSEYLAQAGANYRAEQQADAQRFGQADYNTYKNVDPNDPEQIGAYIKEMGLSSVAGLGTVGAGAVAGGAVGSIFPLVGTAVGAGIGAALAGIGVNIGDVQNKIKEIDPETKSPWASILVGSGLGVLDAAGVKSLAKPFVKELGEEAAFGILKQAGVMPAIAAHAVKGAAVEGSTSAAQSAIGDVTAAYATDTDLNTEKLVENAINSGLGGSIIGAPVGGTFGGVGQAMRNQRAPGTAAPGATFTEGRTEPLNLAQNIWATLGGTATDVLEPLARVSPKAKEFIDSFKPDLTGETATGRTIIEDQALRAGEWATNFETFANQYGSGRKARQQFFDDLADPSNLAQRTPEQQAAITGARQLMDNVLDQAKAADLEVGTIPNYMPFFIDGKKITRNKDAFINDITPYFKDKASATKAVNEWLIADKKSHEAAPEIQKLVTQDQNGNWVMASNVQTPLGPDTMRYRFGQGQTPPEFGQLEKARAFGNVPQAVLNKYAKERTVTQKEAAFRDYFEGAAHRISFADRFGPKGERANAQIAMAIKEAQDSGREVTKAEVDRMFNILDAYNGTYNRIKNQTIKNIQSTAGVVLTAATLPLVTLSSIVEIATPAIRGDISSAIASLVPTFSELAKSAATTLMRGSHKTEFAQVASEANLSFAASQSVAAERLGATMFTRGAAKANRAFFKANGLAYWTHFMTTYAAKTAETIYNRNLFALANGLDGTSAKGANYLNQLRSMGVDVRSQKEAMALWNPQTPAEIMKSRQAKVLAVRRFTRTAVLEPNVADTPLWMNDGRMQMVAMLHRYPAAFTNTILPALFRKGLPSWAGSRTLAGVGATNALFILGFMVLTGYAQDELKMILKTGDLNFDDERDPVERFVDVMNTTVSPLQVSYITDFFAAPRYGTSGVESVLGPAVGKVGEGAKTIYEFAQNPDEGKIWKYLYKLTPAAPFRPGREAASELDVF